MLFLVNRIGSFDEQAFPDGLLRLLCRFRHGLPRLAQHAAVSTLLHPVSMIQGCGALDDGNRQGAKV